MRQFRIASREDPHFIMDIAHTITLHPATCAARYAREVLTGSAR